MNYRVLSAARRELDAAVDGYDAKSPGLGTKFALAFIARRQQAQANPGVFGLTAGAPAGREIREVRIRPFSYKLVYEVLPGELVVLSVLHTRRGAQPWRRRRP